MRDGVEWIIFESIRDLIVTVIGLVDAVEGYHEADLSDGGPREHRFSSDELRNISVNSKRFVDEHFREENVDCFFMNSLMIYNHFIFDTGSIHRSDDDHMFLLPPDLY